MTNTKFIVTPFKPDCCDIIEYTTDEQEALDIALEISVQLHGDPVMIFKNNKEWKLITA